MHAYNCVNTTDSIILLTREILSCIVLLLLHTYVYVCVEIYQWNNIPTPIFKIFYT